MFSDVYKTIERKYEDRRNLAMRNYALAKEKAYAPYSKFPVGACVLTENNNTYIGCNFEKSH